MRIRLTQLDGKLPNLALMRLAAWHRDRGDEIVFSRSPYRDLLEPAYDQVYGSAIFAFSTDRVTRLRAEFPGAIVGGTGAGDPITVEAVTGGADPLPDYSLYPDYQPSIGFLTRGCRLRCAFCVVPNKEGRPTVASTLERLWRGGAHRRHLHLLDNDAFATKPAALGVFWRETTAAIRAGGFKVCFNQGLNARLITDEGAELLASIDYRDDGFKVPRVYTAWDQIGDEEIFFRGIARLERAGIKPTRIMVYMLVGYDPAETMELVLYRYQRMVDLGLMPYPMVYDRSNAELLRFQRWVIQRVHEMVPFAEYNRAQDALARRRRGTADLFGV